MSDEAVVDDPYADRYGAKYSLYGDFDVDAFLTACRPRSPFGVWRAGDPSPLGRVAKSSGVSIDIADDRKTIEPAVLRFLLEEHAFLEAASKIRASTVWSTLTCRMFVYAAVPSGRRVRACELEGSGGGRCRPRSRRVSVFGPRRPMTCASMNVDSEARVWMPTDLFLRDAPRHQIPGAHQSGRARAGQGVHGPVVQPDVLSGERLGRAPRRDAGRITGTGTITTTSSSSSSRGGS